MPAKISFTKDQIDNIIKLYTDGIGPVEIGKIIGVSCSPVIRASGERRYRSWAQRRYVYPNG